MNRGVMVTGAAALVVFAAYFLLQPGTGPGAARAGLLPYDDPEAVARGKEIYLASCAVCHGVNLEGAPDWQTPDEDGMLRPPPHNELGHTWHHADELLFRLTKFGTAAFVGGDYQSNMIGFGDVLSDQQILDTLAYIKSTWPEETIRIHNEINASAALEN